MLRDKPIKGVKFARYDDIPDEFAIRSVEVEKIEKKESARDRTYEEFLSMFADHIEGKVDPNERVGNRPDSAERKDHGADRAAHNDSIDGSRKNQTIASHGRNSAGADSKHSSQRMTGTGKGQDSKHDLPKDCKLTLPAK